MLVCAKAMGQTGQTSQDVDRSQIFRSQPSIRPGEPISQSSNAYGYAAPSANDADLGVQAILKRQEQYQPFTFSASLPYYWTSNVALVPSGEVSDGVLAPAFVFAYQPRLMKTLYGEFIWRRKTARLFWVAGLPSRTFRISFSTHAVTT